MDVYAAAGFLGVPLFVMLSGVLLLDPAKADEPLGVFYKKRFLHIGLPMIFWTIAYFLWGYYIHGTELTPSSIFSGLLSGSYVHLWFLYLLIGLYFVTPVLRIIVKHLDRQKFTLFLAVWFIGTVFEPFMKIFLPNVGFNPVMFVFTGWAGTFLLGVYLLNRRVSSWKLCLCVIAGLLIAVIGDGVAPLFAGAQATGFFHEYLSFSIILASAGVFLLLAAVPKSKVENDNSTISRFVNWVGKNTLGIYLVHIMVLETLEAGYLGLTVNMSTVSPIIEIPLITAITFVLTVAIVYALKKVPYVHKVLG